MSRAFPFRRPPADVIDAGPWSRTVADGMEELPFEIPEWDYDTILSLSRPLRIDGLRARRAIGLPDDAEIDLIVRWSASSSLLRGRAWQTEVASRDGVAVQIEFHLPGDELGGFLELATILTLRRAGDGAASTAPRRPGSALWSDTRRIHLQGDALLFPVALTDFYDLPYPTKASWYVEVGDDLESAALGSVLLLANERRDVVVKALASAGAPTDADRCVLSTLRSDVVRALVERALVNEDFTDEVEYPAGSLGALLAALLRRHFPGFGVEALRRERLHEPTIFTARLQDATDLLAAP